MTHERNTEGLARHTQQKSANTFAKAEQAIQRLLREGRPINFESVAEMAGISKSWLYQQLDDPETGKPGLRTRIEQLRSQTQGRPAASSSKSKAGQDSKNAIVKTLLKRNQDLEKKIKELRQQNEAVTSQSLRIPVLEQQIASLLTENNQLRQQTVQTQAGQSNQPRTESRKPDLKDVKQLLGQVGVTWNNTIARMVAAATSEEIQRAIAALKEQQVSGIVKNPNGYFVEALRDPNWKPSQESEAAQNLQIFKEWYALAQPLYLVSGSRMIEGVMHLITPDDQVVSFEEMLEIYPIEALEEIKATMGFSIS